ncbi:MAG: UDP-N-acetylmuramoyl-L-alanine--D-glutamate ligase, partial [Bacilli bacterium]|nr:UDP-N-acetylmuramoyl-L-alanine--D-glutamate ligase [Bacilli bacterium]
DTKTFKAISEFKPLEYRLEYVGEVNKIRYYVDTLATIPAATKESIEALENVNTLIFGGMDRGISYEGFSEYLENTNIENFICMPTTGYTIGKRINNSKTYFVETLEDAVSLAKKITKEGTICLLSPAAASYEQFKNYAEKGDKFKEYVLKN